MSGNSMLLLVASLTMASALVTDRSNRPTEAQKWWNAVKKLEGLENTWAAQATAFTKCATLGADFNCKESTQKAFTESCAKVTHKVISSSSISFVNDYMTSLCRHMKGWHASTCQIGTTIIVSEMSSDDGQNRQSATQRALKSCNGLWSHYVAEQEQKVKDAVHAKPVSALQVGDTEGAGVVDGTPSLEQYLRSTGQTKALNALLLKKGIKKRAQAKKNEAAQAARFDIAMEKNHESLRFKDVVQRTGGLEEVQSEEDSKKSEEALKAKNEQWDKYVEDSNAKANYINAERTQHIEHINAQRGSETTKIWQSDDEQGQ